IFDLKADRFHPQKKDRPLSAGLIKIKSALVFSFFLLSSSFLLAYRINTAVLIYISIYFATNIVYSLYLKKIMIVDVLIISSGFVIRVLCGGAASGIPISDWLLVCTGLLAMLLGFSKRQGEIYLLQNEAVDHRKNLGKYTLPFLDSLISILSASSIISYTIYTVTGAKEPLKGKMLITVPFVIYGIFRYIYIINEKDPGIDPAEAAFKDPPLFAAVLLWIISVIILLGL
ncbi:MAG: UbiA family prenyltransferase, partial [Fibrobacterota bacterium]